MLILLCIIFTSLQVGSYKCMFLVLLVFNDYRKIETNILLNNNNFFGKVKCCSSVKYPTLLLLYLRVPYI